MVIGRQTCEHCGIVARQRCADCKESYYCCRSHQQLDWHRHRPACQARAAAHKRAKALAEYAARMRVYGRSCVRCSTMCTNWCDCCENSFEEVHPHCGTLKGRALCTKCEKTYGVCSHCTHGM